MQCFTRILKFPENRQGRLYAMAADASTAQRLIEVSARSGPLAKAPAGTKHVFSDGWLDDCPHLRKLDSSGGHSAVDGSQDGPAVWLNARYLAAVDEPGILKAMHAAGTDLVSFTVCPPLQGGRELVRLTASDHVAGYRRLYEDTAEPAPLTEWPHMVAVLSPGPLGALGEKLFSSDLSSFRQAVAEAGLTWLHFRIGGRVLDLESDCADTALAQWPAVPSPWVRPPGRRLPLSPPEVGPESAAPLSLRLRMLRPHTGVFRMRPLLSYARLGKRLFDIVASACILLVIFPLLLAVAMLVKLTSPGPVFYRARRQGLHGKPFDCLKFRTMMLQADAIQYRLRVVNQVDGPQFKIENDPRITGMGKFLRDTCIDELPQFLNVLFGQMSIVGPRPSPASENESCPSWRDARLSVRPGITGLWQVCRTRRNSMDFQEWVYYDTRYVKKLSFRLDLYICFKTAWKLLGNFLDQFG